MRLQGNTSWLMGLFMIFVVIKPCAAQSSEADHSTIISGLNNASVEDHFYPTQQSLKVENNISLDNIYPSSMQNDSLGNESDRKTTSLTAGYVADVFSIQGADGSYRFRFDGETTGLMLSSRSSSLMLTYGFADAEESGGEIRAITADLQLGGNITVFKKFLGLPLRTYIPIRFNFGYRNLELLDESKMK